MDAATAVSGTVQMASVEPTSETKSFLPNPAIGVTSCPQTRQLSRLTLDPALSQMKAVPVRVLAVDVDDPLEARLLEQAGRDARAITRGAMYGDRRIVWNLGRATGNVGHVHVHRAGDMARRPLMLVARVDHRHRLGAKYPLRHVFDVDRFEAREVAAAGAPRIHAAVELTCDGVEADAQELALRLAMVGFAAAGEHDGTPARDEPADPHADRAVDADAVAAWDVGAVVVAAFTHVDHGRASVHHPRDLVGRELGERWKSEPDQRRASPVDRRHVPVVGRIPRLVEDPREKGHDLCGQEERVGLALVAQSRFVSAATPGAAERPAAVGREDLDLVGQPAQAHLQG